MMDLIEFLRARLDEDERVACVRACLTEWHIDDLGDVVDASGGQVASVDHGAPVDAEHIARHDPARVLREVEAKRRMVDHHTTNSERDLCNTCVDVGPDAQGWPCQTLRLLALPYADHPEFKEEWRR